MNLCDLWPTHGGAHRISRERAKKGNGTVRLFAMLLVCIPCRLLPSDAIESSPRPLRCCSSALFPPLRAATALTAVPHQPAHTTATVYLAPLPLELQSWVEASDMWPSCSVAQPVFEPSRSELTSRDLHSHEGKVERQAND